MHVNKDTSARNSCCHLLFAHYIRGESPLVVLECCSCGRAWHQRADGKLVPYERKLLSAPALRSEAQPGGGRAWRSQPE